LGIDTRVLIGIGLLTALVSGLPSLLAGDAFLTGIWGSLTIPDIIDTKIGTPVLFDTGVFLTVIGVTLTMIFALEEVE
jgi:multisubunit Na+/H+ antiporter MnhB subunit